MDAKETAKRHGEYVIAKNWGGVGADFAPGAMEAFQKHGVGPPRGTSKAEFIAESQNGDQFVYEIKYTNDAGDSQVVRSHWGKVGDEWKIVSAEPA